MGAGTLRPGETVWLCTQLLPRLFYWWLTVSGACTVCIEKLSENFLDNFQKKDSNILGNFSKTFTGQFLRYIFQNRIHMFLPPSIRSIVLIAA